MMTQTIAKCTVPSALSLTIKHIYLYLICQAFIQVQEMSTRLFWTALLFVGLTHTFTGAADDNIVTYTLHPNLP